MPAAPSNALPQVPQVKVGGTVLAPEVASTMVEARVSRTIGMASRCELRFSDDDFGLTDNASKFAIGKTIEVSIADFVGTIKPVFKGEVISIAIDQGHSERHEFVVEAFDKAHRLGHVSRARTFLNSTYSDVISTIAGQYGLSADVSASGASSPTFEYLLQNVSDFAFIDRMAMRIGAEWFVDDTKLVVRDRPSTESVVLEYGENLIRFRARFSGSEHIGEVQTAGWDYRAKQRVVGTDTAKVATPDNSTVTGGLQTLRTDAKNAFTGTKLVTGATVVEMAAEATTVAKAIGTRQATAELIAKGEAIGNPDLKAGTKVEIKGIGTRLGGKYYVTEIEHVYGRRGDVVTRFTAGGLENSSIVDLLRAGGPDDIGPWGREGLVTGIVTNNKDPDKLGRVKVKFPTLSDELESNWARLVSVGAGPERGWQIIPEINDEVIVGFEHGDLRRPYVLGSVWNKDTKMPVENTEAVVDGKVVKWSIQSRLAHKIVFDDGSSDSTRGMTLVTGDGKTTLELQHGGIKLTTKDQPIEIGNGKAKIVLAANGDITIEGENVTVTAKQKLSEKGGTGVEVKADTNVAIEGQSGVEVKSNAPVKVTSAAILELKGSLTKIN